MLCSAVSDGAEWFERRFARAGWQGIWRNGVFAYHHYHPEGHEVLGVAAGTAKLMLGGPEGKEIAVHRGDCLVLPAGTGHKRLSASADFLVIGGYPPGERADILTAPPTKEQLQRIRSLPIPTTDPVHGERGPLTTFWQEALRTSG